MNYYSIDIDYLKNVPIHQAAARLGISFEGKRNRCFCPDPLCPDSGSRNRGAGINKKNNTVHCFVCGQTWNPYTLAGLMEFGYDQGQCYTKDGIQAVGRFMGEDLGYGGAELIQSGEGWPSVPQMPVVSYQYETGGNAQVPLFKCFGLTMNPLASIFRDSIPDISPSQGAWILFQKGLECIEEAFGMIEEARKLDDEWMGKNYAQLVHAAEDYLPRIYPLLSPLEADRRELAMTLAYHYVTTDHPDIRRYLETSFAEPLEPFLGKLDKLYGEPEIPAERERA